MTMICCCTEKVCLYEFLVMHLVAIAMTTFQDVWLVSLQVQEQMATKYVESTNFFVALCKWIYDVLNECSFCHQPNWPGH